MSSVAWLWFKHGRIRSTFFYLCFYTGKRFDGYQRIHHGRDMNVASL